MRIRHAIAPRDPSQRRDARFPDLLDHRPRIGGKAVGLLGLRAVTDPAHPGQLGTAELHAPGLGGRQRVPASRIARSLNARGLMTATRR